MPRRIANRIVAAGGIALIALTMLNSVANVQTIASPTSVIHDRNFIAAMNDISALVPPGSVIVVSTNAPFVIYFTGHTAKVPFGVSSKAALVEYMKKNHYGYLVVFAGDSQVPALRSLFSSQHVLSLETDFQLMANFQTDFSQIYLFTLRNS